MSRRDYPVTTEAQRATLIADIRKAPLGFHATCKRNKRTVSQNDRMWAMLTIISREVDWHGQHLSPEDWKLMFMSGLNQEMRLVPNIHGNGFVHLGRSSSKLTKEEFSDLMELIDMFAAERGVDLSEQRTAA